MRAVRVHNYGDANVLTIEDAPRPAPGDGELRVRVFATSINPFDVALRSGYMAGMLNSMLPLIPGTDTSGGLSARKDP
ncbi:MAG: hypothetical protein ACM30E_04785 [Nitrososphaerales archaeon]